MKLHVYRETVSHFESKKLLHITCDYRLPREVNENCVLLGYLRIRIWIAVQFRVCPLKALQSVWLIVRFPFS